MGGASSERRGGLIRGARPATIRVRLAGAFVLVAIVSVGLVASLSLIFGERDLSALAAQRRADVVQSMVLDAATAHSASGGGWVGADLEPVRAVARSAGAGLAVLDAGGGLVTATANDPRQGTGATRVPILTRGEPIGTLVVRFENRGIEASATRLRRAFALAVIAASGLACLLALSVAAVASRRLTRPLLRLVTTARAVAAGDRAARVGPVDAAPEIRELTASVDAMTDTLVRQEQLHRDLVADVAHELRTPISVLRIACEAMLDELIVPTAAEIGSLHEEVLRLARLVDDLQTLAAADADALHLMLGRADLAAVATEAADALATRFAAAELTLHRVIAPAIVHGDPSRLRQVVLNLLTNAAKFTPPGGAVTLALRCTAGRAELEVSDTGVGISEEDLPHVLERFWRSRHTIGTTGTGIGLAIVAELTRAHGGTVEVRSRPGVGTTVTISLPVAA
jgi:signal transduction histidine kinase